MDPRVPVERAVPDHGRVRRVLLWLLRLALRLARKGIVAYVVIAFVIGFGFHIEERRTDNKIQGAVDHLCRDSNDRLRILVGAQQYLQFKSDDDERAFLAELTRLQPAKCRETDK